MVFSPGGHTRLKIWYHLCIIRQYIHSKTSENHQLFSNCRLIESTLQHSVLLLSPSQVPCQVQLRRSVCLHRASNRVPTTALLPWPVNSPAWLYHTNNRPQHEMIMHPQHNLSPAGAPPEGKGALNLISRDIGIHSRARYVRRCLEAPVLLLSTSWYIAVRDGTSVFCVQRASSVRTICK